MNITVQSIHFDADSKLVGFIREKLLKLSQFTDDIHAAEVFLKLENDGANRENKVVEVRLAVPGNDLFAKRQDKSFEEAATAAVEALRSQVERGKTKSR
jgi:putative sigma-54 modulation protein